MRCLMPCIALQFDCALQLDHALQLCTPVCSVVVPLCTPLPGSDPIPIRSSPETTRNRSHCRTGSDPTPLQDPIPLPPCCRIRSHSQWDPIPHAMGSDPTDNDLISSSPWTAAQRRTAALKAYGEPALFCLMHRSLVSDDVS